MTTIEISKPISESISDQRTEGISIWSILIFGLLGVLISAITIPILLPSLMSSMTGEQPKVFWYLSRGTAIISYLFLWTSMVLGLLITGKTAKFFPGAYTANDLHQFVSISGLATGLLHGLLLLGDKYFNINIFQVMIPFAESSFRPFWVGLGQISLYLWLILIISNYLKKVIGYKVWRSLHLVSFLTFVGITIHGFTSGTDSGLLILQIIYWISAGSVILLTFYRILAKATN